jgi:hypothetical protein
MAGLNLMINNEKRLKINPNPTDAIIRKEKVLETYARKHPISKYGLLPSIGADDFQKICEAMYAYMWHRIVDGFDPSQDDRVSKLLSIFVSEEVMFKLKCDEYANKASSVNDSFPVKWRALNLARAVLLDCENFPLLEVGFDHENEKSQVYFGIESYYESQMRKDKSQLQPKNLLLASTGFVLVRERYRHNITWRCSAKTPYKFVVNHPAVSLVTNILYEKKDTSLSDNME